MAEYIEREKIEKFFDGIYDCADLTFEPNDHCCAPDDCAHCKWYEAMKAIRKRILSIHAADVRPVVRGHWRSRFYYRESTNAHDCEMHICSECSSEWSYDAETGLSYNFCPNCGAMMEES